MTSEHTEHQDPGQIQAARDLSLKPKSPPASVPGYDIEGLLGSGAYGEVWMALDKRTGRRVAIKFYTRQTSLDFSLLSREVEKLVFLSADRYVVQLLDVGWDAKPPFYVMDFIENGSLEDELKRRDVLPVDEAVELIEEICIGLMHLHGKGILHCDLKPGNVLLDQDKKPRLADFGQSRLSHEQAPALGTLFFMAPEQADLRAAPDARWDVYALGALLYCMLTGEPPFRDEAMLKKIESSEAMEDRLAHYRKLIENAPPPNRHRRVPGVDRGLAEIIDRCITRNPKQRFTSVQSVYQALRQRELAHAKRPLMILGLVGPLLLLAVMSLFGWNAYRGAISQTDETITRQILESNRWIARLAARSAAEQIDNYFRVLNDLVGNRDFQRQVAEVLDAPSVQAIAGQLADPAQNENLALDSLRQQLIQHRVRQQLQRPLARNLNDPSYPTAASWFVTNPAGTQIASVFNKEDPTNTIGKNYSYRSYFTGRNREARSTRDERTTFDVSEDPNQRDHIVTARMSAIFKSKATSTWKIAFSAPLYYEDRFLGIAAVTADMGSFIEFDKGADQYVMLVDGRPGQYQGTVLEHRLLSSLAEAHEEIPENLISQRVDDDVLDNFANGVVGLDPFIDPLSSEEQGREYDRRWLASWARVRRRVGSDEAAAGPEATERVDTGFRVIAVADHDSAVEPSKKLGRQLARMATLAVLFFLLVSGGLLYTVFRSLKQSREKVSRMLGVPADSSITGGSLHDAATLMAPSDVRPKKKEGVS